MMTEMVRGVSAMPKTVQKLVLANTDKIEECSNEIGSDDGYWLYLKSGWSFEGETHSVHEWSVKDLLSAFKNVEPCACGDCQADLKKNS